MTMTTMSRAAWKKTPYATTRAADPDTSLRKLLGKYQVRDIQTTETTVNGRHTISLRFRHQDKTYRIALPVLDADAEHEELVRQVKRAIFFYLKAALEAATYFFTPEQALFAFIETANEQTIYELAAPKLKQITSTAGFVRAIENRRDYTPSGSPGE